MIKKINKIFSLFYKSRPSLHLQFSETECGIAALAMILAHYGTHLSLDILREKCGSSRDGCKASTLIQAAREYGYDADCYTIDLDDLVPLNHPVIAFWKFNHYVVIYKTRAEKFYIHDPATGSMVIGQDEFDKKFTGIIIDIFPGENFIRLKKIPILLPLFKECIAEYHVELKFIMFCLLIMATMPLLNSVISTLFVNFCVIGNQKDWIPMLAIFSFGTIIILAVSGIYHKWTQFKLCAKASILMSSVIISHLVQLPLMYFSLRQKGELIANLSRVDGVVNSLIKNISLVLINAVIGCIWLIIMINMDTYMFMISLILVLIKLLITMALLNKYL